MMIGLNRRMRLTDAEIRKRIHVEIIPTIIGDTHNRVIDEMGICCGEARVDIAVINGKLHGFEIKSEADTLERLEGQILAYNQVFDTMTIICGQNHLDSIISLVPEWWGIYSAKINFGKLELTKIRCSELNHSVCRLALAKLLWKSELLMLLAEAGVRKGVSNKPCRELWKRVSEIFTTETLQIKVRETLKSRECWRLDLQQT